MRHAVAVSVRLIALLLLLGAPFLGVKWGFPDDRVLPVTARSRQVGDLLRNEFAVNPVTNVTVVIPESPACHQRAECLRRGSLAGCGCLGGIVAVGTFADGRLTGPPSAPTGLADGRLPHRAEQRPAVHRCFQCQLRALHAVPGPAGHPVLFARRRHRYNVDSVDSITSRLPIALGVIAVITFVLLFLMTGSVVCR